MSKTVHSVSGSKIVVCLPQGTMVKRTAITAWLHLGTLVLCASFFAPRSSGQIAKVLEPTGRQLFVNAEPPRTFKLAAARPHATIYLPAESSFTGGNRPAMSIDRDGGERHGREAGERDRRARTRVAQG